MGTPAPCAKASRSLSHQHASTSCASQPLDGFAARHVHRGAGTSSIRPQMQCQATDQDVDWEPAVKRPGPLMAPSSGNNRQSGLPPLPPRPRKVAWWEAPFTSRRNIGLTMLAGSASLWLYNNKAGPIQMIDKPDIPFKLLGFTDLAPDDFVYFKTKAGTNLAAARDDAGRLFMIDQAGDLYYDSGDPNIGWYAMDTQGNLFNFYNDVGGASKITPVGNIRDMRSFKISELAGVKLDRQISVVGFQDDTAAPLPPGTGYVDSEGRFVPPGELVEGYTSTGPPDSMSNFFSELLGRGGRSQPPDRFEVDLKDPTPFQRQLYDQVLFDDPYVPGFQPALPRDYSLQQLQAELRAEEELANRRRKRAPPLRAE